MKRFPDSSADTVPACPRFGHAFGDADLRLYLGWQAEIWLDDHRLFGESLTHLKTSVFLDLSNITITLGWHEMKVELVDGAEVAALPVVPTVCALLTVRAVLTMVGTVRTVPTMRTCLRTYLHSFLHTCLHACHPCMCPHTYLHTCLHTRLHARLRTSLRTRLYTSGHYTLGSP